MRGFSAFEALTSNVTTHLLLAAQPGASMCIEAQEPRRTFERSILQLKKRRRQENLITIITIMGDKPRSGKRQIRFYDLGIESFAI